MPSHTSLKAFLAEDSIPLRERIHVLLENAGVRVVGEASTPQECIDGIEASHPDVVVLDVRLEGGTGVQVLRALRAHPPAPAFVVFSSSSAPVYRKRYLEEGAVDFLDKTADFDRLAAAVVAAGAPRAGSGEGGGTRPT